MCATSSFIPMMDTGFAENLVGDPTEIFAGLAKDQAKKELLDYAAREYLGGKASLSELSKKTGLDVPMIMDEIARIQGGEKRTVEAFLSAVETLSKVKEDPELYNLAVKALRE